mmetsp:Transcript_71604/g.165585  ORF Transcript_71604/g.165585 Transcript_71604/m.165585 type:complete len:244 (-) Transcript_71604:101-832(-)
MTDPVDPPYKVRLVVDPISSGLYIETLVARHKPPPLPPQRLWPSPPRHSALWWAQALAYGTVADVLLVRVLIPLVRPLLGRAPTDEKRPAKPDVKREPKYEPKHELKHEAKHEVSVARPSLPPRPPVGGLGQVPQRRIGVAVLAGALAGAVLFRLARRRHSGGGPGVDSNSRGPVTALPHGLIQRRVLADSSAPKRSSTKSVTWTDTEWLTSNDSDSRSQSSSRPPNTEFFRICSEAAPTDER